MSKLLEKFNQAQLKQNLPDIRPGDTVRVHQKFKEGDKERKQIFEGVVLARKHGKGVSSSFIVRRVISGIGVERTFPLHSPLIERIEVLKRGKVRRAKLYYLRKAKGKKARLKRAELKIAVAEKKSTEKEPVKEVQKEESKEETKRENK